MIIRKLEEWEEMAYNSGGADETTLLVKAGEVEIELDYLKSIINIDKQAFLKISSRISEILNSEHIDQHCYAVKLLEDLKQDIQKLLGE